MKKNMIFIPFILRLSAAAFVKYIYKYIDIVGYPISLYSHKYIYTYNDIKSTFHDVLINPLTEL